MMAETTRMLKRGLKDISPLFGSSSGQKGLKEREEPSIQCISIFSPDNSGDSLFLNTLLASQMASAERTCSIISIGTKPGRQESGVYSPSVRRESLSAYLSQVRLTCDEALMVMNRPVQAHTSNLRQSTLLFLDIDFTNVTYFERLIPMLDKWVFLIQPTAESVIEAYRMIKGTRMLNPSVEYFVIVEGRPEDEAASIIFERFSELLARQLGIHLGWLGYLHPPRTSKSFSADLEIDQLYLNGIVRNDQPEKIALAELVVFEREAAAGGC